MIAALRSLFNGMSTIVIAYLIQKQLPTALPPVLLKLRVTGECSLAHRITPSHQISQLGCGLRTCAEFPLNWPRLNSNKVSTATCRFSMVVRSSRRRRLRARIISRSGQFGLDRPAQKAVLMEDANFPKITWIVAKS